MTETKEIKKYNIGTLFLQRFLELQQLERDVAKWSIESLSNNPPRYIRYQILQSLSNALGMNITSFTDVIHGEFITKSYMEYWDRYFDLVKDLSDVDPKDFVQHGRPFDSRSFSALKFNFTMLFNYRMLQYKMMHCMDGVLAASDYYITPLEILKKFNNRSDKEAELLDQLLVFLLNPKEIMLSKAELEFKWGFPEDDLRAVDLDYI